VEITEVKISLREGGNKKLKAYTTVTFDDCFVVRNIKVIEGNSGLFVAMPARKMKQFCPRCGKKIELRSRYCSQCGTQLPPAPKDMDCSCVCIPFNTWVVSNKTIVIPSCQVFFPCFLILVRINKKTFTDKYKKQLKAKEQELKQKLDDKQQAEIEKQNQRLKEEEAKLKKKLEEKLKKLF